MDGLEEHVTSLTASAGAVLAQKWRAHPEQVVTSTVVVLVLIFYIRRVSPMIIGIWCFFFSAFCTVTYLRLRSKAFELIPIVIMDNKNNENDSSAVHSVARRVSRRWEVCHVCLQQECTCSSVAEATESVDNSVLVSPAVNILLADIFKLVVDQYVQSWYSLYSTDPEYVVEVQIMMKHIAGSFASRIRNIDTARVVRTSLLPALINHVEAYLIAENRVRREGDKGDPSIHHHALALYGHRLHAAFASEERYFRTVFMNALSVPGVLDRGKSKCRSIKLFIAQSMYSAVKSAIHTAAQPSTINNAIISSLVSQQTPGDAPKRAPRRRHSGSTYEPLCDFVPTTAPRKSIFQRDAHAVLSDPQLRLEFQVYATRTGDIDALMLYRRLEDMMGTLHSAITAATVPKFHEYAVDVTTLVAVLPVGPIVCKRYCSAIRQIAESSVTTLKPEYCSKKPFEEMWTDIQALMKEDIVPAFLRSREYYSSIVTRPDMGLGRQKGQKEKDVKASKKKDRRRSAEIQAEIELLNLPPPPSAVEEEHPDLVADANVKKRKNLFQRIKSDRPTLGRSRAASDAPLKAASATTSPAGSPTVARRRPPKVDSPGKSTSTTGSPAGSPVPTRRRPLSENFEETLDPAALQQFASAQPRRRRKEDGGEMREDEDTPSVSPDAGDAQAMKTVEHKEELPRYDLTGVSTVVKDFSKRHQGSRQYVIYTIAVTQRGEGLQESGSAGGIVLSTGNVWEVTRRYSDFATLESKLKRLYPDFDLATLPDKRRFGNLEKKHLDHRKALLHEYLSSLVENPLIHNDVRCAEIVHKFLDPKCDFKDEMKHNVIRGVSRKPIVSSLLGKNKDWSSFTSLFTVTLDEVEELNSLAYGKEVEIWAKLRPELDAARAEPDKPLIDSNALESLSDDSVDCFATETTPEPSVSARVVRLLGTMSGRLRYSWLPQSLLGLGKLLLGSSLEANLKLACEGAIKLDEATLLSSLESAKASLEKAAAEATADTESPAGSKAPTSETGNGRSDSELAAEVRRIAADIVPALFPQVFGEHELEGLTASLVEVFQDETYNRQLVYTAMDGLVSAVFPELARVDSA